MSITEAMKWVEKIPQDDEVGPEQEAWLKDNDNIIQEAISVYRAHVFPSFPEDTSTQHSGSLFSRIYIAYRHQGFTYIVSDAEHVAALHAFRNRPSAIVYLCAHAESRVADDPIVISVPALWHPDVFSGTSHPAERTLHQVRVFDDVPAALHDAAAFPTFTDVEKANEDRGMGMVRYTLHGWQKQNMYMSRDGWCAMQHYFTEHYDLKEVLDSEGNVLSSEHGVDPSAARL
ncbi:hypothetical protein B0H16DRAFT_1885687 [Mycena metata]|uniref:Uncharacterized protein n=1 Tax=Mycena metata TaxID=1033252 RepID=A0AAD7NEI3_9AGAR|nr:hypothetical protein B0H16DRAFT_1885687 [Mycena metata]